MPTEPTELTEARALLGRFELDMHRPESLVHLSDALSLLADMRADAGSEPVKLVASNLSLAYLKKAQAAVEELLAREPSVHWDIVDHWQEVFAEFERSGFALPRDISETRSKLLMKKMNREIALMSPSERKALIEKLEATGDE
jgi:hypothetical protein